DAPAMQQCIDATTGYPLSGTISTREAGPPIEWSAGVYLLKTPLHATDVTGLRIRGAGQSNTYINFAGGETGTATSGTTTTLTNSGKSWTVNQWAGGDWYVYIYTGTGAGQYAAITSNTATVLTLDRTLTTAPDSTSLYAIEARAVLQLDGVFTSQFEEFQIAGSNGFWKHGILYYRHSASSARGSSQCRLTNVS